MDDQFIAHIEEALHLGQVPPAAMKVSAAVVEDDFENAAPGAGKGLVAHRDDLARDGGLLALLQLPDFAELASVFVASRRVEQQISYGDNAPFGQQPCPRRTHPGHRRHRRLQASRFRGGVCPGAGHCRNGSSSESRFRHRCLLWCRSVVGLLPHASSRANSPSALRFGATVKARCWISEMACRLPDGHPWWRWCECRLRNERQPTLGTAIVRLGRGSGADLETRSPGEPALVFVEGEQFGRLQVERRGDVENVETAVTAGLRVSAREQFCAAEHIGPLGRN